MLQNGEPKLKFHFSKVPGARSFLRVAAGEGWSAFHTAGKARTSLALLGGNVEAVDAGVEHADGQFSKFALQGGKAIDQGAWPSR